MDHDAPTPHRFDRRPGLPSGRSLLGGLLVAVAGLGTFAAARPEPAPPPPLQVVAARAVEPGQLLEPGDLALAPALVPDAEALLFDDPAELTGAVALAALGPGELVQRSAVLLADAPGVAPVRQVSFRIDPARALAGQLRPGERLDVLATIGTGDSARTEQVAAAAVVVRVSVDDAGLGGGGMAVTLALDDAAELVPVAHAATAGTLTLVRGVPS